MRGFHTSSSLPETSHFGVSVFLSSQTATMQRSERSRKRERSGKRKEMTSTGHCIVHTLLGLMARPHANQLQQWQKQYCTAPPTRAVNQRKQSMIKKRQQKKKKERFRTGIGDSRRSSSSSIRQMGLARLRLCREQANSLTD